MRLLHVECGFNGDSSLFRSEALARLLDKGHQGDSEGNSPEDGTLCQEIPHSSFLTITRLGIKIFKNEQITR